MRIGLNVVWVLLGTDSVRRYSHKHGLEYRCNPEFISNDSTDTAKLAGQ